MKLAEEVITLCEDEKIPVKVKVIKREMLLEAYPEAAKINMRDAVDRGVLRHIILDKLNTLAVLKEKTCTLSSLAKDFDRKAIWKHYSDIVDIVKKSQRTEDIYI